MNASTILEDPAANRSEQQYANSTCTAIKLVSTGLTMGFITAQWKITHFGEVFGKINVSSMAVWIITVFEPRRNTITLSSVHMHI